MKMSWPILAWRATTHERKRFKFMPPLLEDGLSRCQIDAVNGIESAVRQFS